MTHKLFILYLFLVTPMVATTQILVWPGDANQNGVVNNVDLLPLGLAYNFFGPARDSIDADFEEQTAVPWNFSFPNGANFANADCNGDGLINYFYDAFPIYVHYGNTHGTVTPDVFLTGMPGIDPPLYFDDANLQTPVSGGSVIDVPLALGTETLPVDNLYGIVFSIHVEPSVIDIDQTQLDFSELSWANPDLDRIFSVYRVSPSRLDVAWVRTDRNEKSGFGAFAKAKFIIIDNVVTLQKPGTTITIDSIKMIDRFGNETAVAGIELYVPLLPDAVSEEHQPAPSSVSISPNPSPGHLFVQSDDIVQQVRLLDIAGTPVAVLQPESDRFNWNIRALPAGMYLCEIQTARGITVRKIAIQQ